MVIMRELRPNIALAFAGTRGLRLPGLRLPSYAEAGSFGAY